MSLETSTIYRVGDATLGVPLMTQTYRPTSYVRPRWWRRLWTWLRGGWR
jgi:hypothetical protein